MSNIEYADITDKKILIMMDSFKGSLTSEEAGDAVKNGLLGIGVPENNIKILPIADGGEGTTAAIGFASNKTEYIELEVCGPLGEDVTSSYSIITTENANIAVMDMASAAGLTLVPEDRRNPMVATTYGLGQMISDAIERGITEFIIGLGGSATNDGGIGMLQALGFKFLDSNGNSVSYNAEGIYNLATIESDSVNPKLSSCKFHVACDVENPLVGELGASYVFAPQKGATLQMVEELDKLMNRYADVVEETFSGESENDRYTEGAGAAGGLGYAFTMFLDAKLRPGVDIILDIMNVDEIMSKADILITGEGKLDSQSLMGKTICRLSRRFRKTANDKTVIAFAGIVDSDIDKNLLADVLDGYFETMKKGQTVNEACVYENAYNNLKDAVICAFKS